MLIDQWLLESMDISLCLPDPSYHIILLPELQISSLGDDPAEVKYGKCVTYITGSTDYAL
jgi:hypothetical protein